MVRQLLSFSALLTLLVCLLTAVPSAARVDEEKCERGARLVMDRAWITTVPHGPLDPGLNISLLYQTEACWKVGTVI